MGVFIPEFFLFEIVSSCPSNLNDSGYHILGFVFFPSEVSSALLQCYQVLMIAVRIQRPTQCSFSL